jgi:hypothetical protein
MIDSITELRNTLEETLLQPNENANVEKSERVVSILTGTFILWRGLTNIFSSPVIALGEVAIGGSLLHRGVTGYCPVKAVAAIESAPQTILITEIQEY